jgi:hypothetical protein
MSIKRWWPMVEVLVRVAAASIGGYWAGYYSYQVMTPFPAGDEPYGIDTTICFVIMGLTAGAMLARGASRVIRSRGLALYAAVVAAFVVYATIRYHLSWQDGLPGFVYAFLVLGTARFVCRKWPRIRQDDGLTPGVRVAHNFLVFCGVFFVAGAVATLVLVPYRWPQALLMLGAAAWLFSLVRQVDRGAGDGNLPIW